MRRPGTRHASLGREDAECRDGANGWFSLGCSAGSCGRTSGAGVNYWGGSIRRKNNLAPQVGLEPTTLRLTAEFQGEAVRTKNCKSLKLRWQLSYNYPVFRMALQKSSYKSSYSPFGRTLLLWNTAMTTPRCLTRRLELDAWQYLPSLAMYGRVKEAEGALCRR